MESSRKTVTTKNRLESDCWKNWAQGKTLLVWAGLAADGHITACFPGHLLQVWVESSATGHHTVRYFLSWAAVSLLGWLTDMSVEQLNTSLFLFSFFFPSPFPTCILKAGPECPLFNASGRVSACTFMWSWGMCNSVLNFKASHRFCCLHLANLWKWEMLTQQCFHRVRLQEAFSKLWLCILAVKLPVISAGVTQLNPQATLSEDDLYLKED